MGLGDPSQHQSDRTQWEEAHGGKTGVNRTFNKQTRMALWEQIGPVLLTTGKLGTPAPSTAIGNYEEPSMHEL